MNNKKILIWIPIIVSVSIVLGLIIGNNFSNQKYISDNDRKLNTILNLINEEYVDTVNTDELIEQSIPGILTNLDPHSTYIPAKDLKDVNGELEGSFSGIGVSFVMLNDSVTIVEVISGGPSEKAGLIAGDRIVSVNDSSIIGYKQDQVMKTLRGQEGSIVKLGIKRSNSKKTLSFDVIRGKIPVNTIDASYMIDNETGYIKINKFGQNTYQEFLTSMLELKQLDAKKFIIDLRENGGGLMEPAILMANEFLPQGSLIVFTKGRERRNEQEFWSDGNGTFTDDQVIVLIDEYTASASEIFSGALQDNDRALIIGRRSFGKGLIQQQFPLADNSALRLTIGKYFTPSGRCIQKYFKPGNESQYSLEVYDRYVHGELYSSDSIKVKEDKIFKTKNGRKVYGGGGIIPDIFVPNDTSGITSYYVNVLNNGLLQKFSFKYTDINREAFKGTKDYKALLKKLPADNVILSDFVYYAAENGVPARWYYINLSSDLIVSQLKSLIARDLLGNEAFYPIFNSRDNNISTALKAFKENKALPPITTEMQYNNGKQE